jgi:hypothetical protein
VLRRDRFFPDNAPVREAMCGGPAFEMPEMRRNAGDPTN